MILQPSLGDSEDGNNFLPCLTNLHFRSGSRGEAGNRKEPQATPQAKLHPRHLFPGEIHSFKGWSDQRRVVSEQSASIDNPHRRLRGAKYRQFAYPTKGCPGLGAPIAPPKRTDWAGSASAPWHNQKDLPP